MQDLLGRNLTDVLYGDADQALADIVNRLYLDQFISDCPCCFKNSQNRPLRQRWSFRAEYENRGEILIIKGLGYAILPQKQREIVLNDAWAQLKSEMSRKTAELLDMNHRLQQALAERQQAERDYHMLIDNANEMIYVHDLEGRFLSMNGAGRQILGYNFDAPEGLSIFDVLPEEYWTMVKERIQQKIRDNVPTTYALEAMTCSGNRLALEVSTRLIVRSGRPFAIQGIARDITERKQTELALIQSEQRLMDIINFLPDATFVINREGKVIAWNRAIEEMTGIRAVDILDQGDYAYALPFYGEKRPILIDLVLRPEEVGSSQYLDLQYDHDRLVGESYCPCIGGNGAILQGTASPLCDMTGSVVGAIESIRDITERKNTEQQMQSIIDFLPDATFVINRAGTLIAWNRAMEKMSGMKARDMVGKGNYEYSLPLYGERRPILADIVLDPTIEPGGDYQDLYRHDDYIVGVTLCPMIGINGAVLQCTASVLYDITGSKMGAIETIRDITERRNTEQRLQDIIDFLPDATFVIDNSHKVIAWNRAMEKMTNLRAVDMLGKGDFAYAVPFFKNSRPMLVDYILDPNLLCEEDYVYSESDNRYTCEQVTPGLGSIINASASILYDVTGNVVGAIESLRDVTERKNTEQRLQDIIDFLPDATFVVDQAGQVIAWNRAIENMTGIPSHQMIGKGNYEYALPFYGERRPILIDLVLAPDAVGRDKYLSIDSDHNHLSGESFCPKVGNNGLILYGTASPLCDATGKIVGAIESIRDITGRKNTEQRLQDIIDFLPDATVVIDLEGCVIAWNRAIEKMTGIKSDQMIGRGDYQYAIPFYGERRPILIDLVLDPAAVGREKYISIETEKNHLSGESFCPMVGSNGLILYGTASPLYDATGKIVGAIESIRDVTERKNAEHQLLDIINFLPDATVVVNTHGEVIHWNRATEEMTGIKAEDMVGKGNYEYSIPFYGKRRPALIDGVLHPDILNDEQYKHINQKGSVFSGELFCSALGEQGTVIFGTATPLYDVTGTMVGAIETVRDVTEQKKIEVALRNSEENFRKLAEIAPAMIFVMQGDTIIYVNKTAEIITGYTQTQLMEQPPGVLIHPNCQEWVEKISLGWKYGEGIPNRYQTRLVKRNGAEVWLDLSVTPVDFNGQPAILGVGIDITEQKLAEDEIRYLSYHDKLTGLYNRAYFEEQLQLYDDEQHLPLSLIMGDLNGLKMINDAFGHVKGDQLLRNVARVLESCCRFQDIIARWGGDEFVVLLPNTREEEAGKIAETISKSCLTFDDFPVQVSISVGIATKSSVAKSMENVSKEAEDQMYRTKLLDSKSNRSTFMNSLEKTLWVRSHETQAHTHRLRSLVVEIARSLQLSSSDIQSLNLLASLHDIGKIAVPNTILDKPGRLTDEEWEMMKKHPEIGYRIAMSSPELAVIAEAILTHHERWDGTGYPMGLKGSEIPLHARILSIADAYDVMISGRPYQTEISQADALKEIARCAGSQFDPGLARLFIRLVETDFAPDECGSDLNCFEWNEDIR